MTDLHHIFVYGTLKKGQCREKCWPITPVAILPAWTVGCLYDLGPYPAMLPGRSRVAGQLWSFQKKDVLTVTTVLDQIEVTNQPGVRNEYDRVEVSAFTLDGQEYKAEAYHFSKRQFGQFAAKMSASITYQNHRYVVWPTGASWPE